MPEPMTEEEYDRVRASVKRAGSADSKIVPAPSEEKYLSVTKNVSYRKFGGKALTD